MISTANNISIAIKKSASLEGIKKASQKKNLPLPNLGNSL
jgi:hypothetical protein